MSFLERIEAQLKIIASETLTLWHGGNLESLTDAISHKGGRWEHGPGLYLTTHYGTAKKYAKGSRKLYKVVVRKGTDLYDANIPLVEVTNFIDTFVIKNSRKDIIDRLQKFISADNSVPASIFLNLIINGNAIKSTNTNQLRLFLVDQGIDYAVVDNAFGWRERMLVVFNMKIIVSKTRIHPSDEIDEFDLPTEFN